VLKEKRLVQEFMKLVAMDSPSRQEGEVAVYLKSAMKGLGMEVAEDGVAAITGGSSGNLLGKMKGNTDLAPSMLLNAHMDTVAPGLGIEPVVRDGTIYSRGATILGSDDKSGIAIILEVLRILKELDIPHGPIEVLFTVCEEVGLLGAKNFDVSLLQSEFGYSLDSSRPSSLVYSAPAANHVKFVFHGKEAHAGLSRKRG